MLKKGEYNERVDSKVRRIIGCLDLSKVPPALQRGVASELAVCLKETLDRLDASMWEEISDVEQLKGSDDSKLLQRWRIPGTEIAIARALGGPMQGEYLFDPDTVDRAKDFYFLVQDLPSRQEGHQEYAVGIY